MVVTEALGPANRQQGTIANCADAAEDPSGHDWYVLVPHARAEQDYAPGHHEQGKHAETDPTPTSGNTLILRVPIFHVNHAFHWLVVLAKEGLLGHSPSCKVVPRLLLHPFPSVFVALGRRAWSGLAGCKIMLIYKLTDGT